MTESAVGAASHSTSADTGNFGDLVEDALLQAKTLVQAELSLARRELSSEVQGALGSLGLLLVGAMFLQAALVALGVLIIIALGVGAGAGAIVVLALTGTICAAVALRSLAKRKLPRTSARLALDAKQVLETVK